jgi:hypothetical protein
VIDLRRFASRERSSAEGAPRLHHENGNALRRVLIESAGTTRLPWIPTRAFKSAEGKNREIFSLKFTRKAD